MQKIYFCHFKYHFDSSYMSKNVSQKIDTFTVSLESMTSSVDFQLWRSIDIWYIETLDKILVTLGVSLGGILIIWRLDDPLRLVDCVITSYVTRWNNCLTLIWSRRVVTCVVILDNLTLVSFRAWTLFDALLTALWQSSNGFKVFVSWVFHSDRNNLKRMFVCKHTTGQVPCDFAQSYS